MQNYSDRGNSLVMPPPVLTLVIVSSYISLINFIYLIGTYLSKKITYHITSLCTLSYAVSRSIKII